MHAFGLTKHGRESYVVFSKEDEYKVSTVVDDDIVISSSLTLTAQEAKMMHYTYLKQGWLPMKKCDLECVLGASISYAGPPRGLHWTSKLVVIVGVVAMMIV